MKTPIENKSSLEEIEKRFDGDVDRFSNLKTGQSAIMDAPLVMELITRAAVNSTARIRRVLDVGCGAGNNTLKLLGLVPSMNCDLVDLSRPMLDKARQRIAAVNSATVRTFQGDFMAVDLPEEGYDVIMAAAVLHHLRQDRDWEAAFDRLYRLTAPGGSLWISDLVFHESASVQALMWDRYAQYLESLGGNDYKNTVFEYIDKEDTPRPLTYQLDLLRRAGFSRIDVLHKNACFAAFGAIKTG